MRPDAHGLYRVRLEDRSSGSAQGLDQGTTFRRLTRAGMSRILRMLEERTKWFAAVALLIVFIAGLVISQLCLRQTSRKSTDHRLA